MNVVLYLVGRTMFRKFSADAKIDVGAIGYKARGRGDVRQQDTTDCLGDHAGDVESTRLTVAAMLW